MFFPVKPIIKTYVALCKSCSPIIVLQLSCLEIFKFYSRILSFAFLTRDKRKNGHLAPAFALSRHGRRGRACHVLPAPRSGVRTPRVPRYGPGRAGGSARPLGRTPHLGVGRILHTATCRAAPLARVLGQLTICDRTAQINSILLPKPLHLAIKQ
jgi:hypothetical protein